MEWIDKDLGAVSAYAIAVKNGYAGTEAEWEAYIANASTNAQNAAASATAAAESATAAAGSATAAAASAADALQHTQSVIENWLGNNIDPATGYALDRTLALSNAAAPADMVGDLKSALNSVDSVMPSLIGDQIINPANYEIGGIYIPATPPWNYEWSAAKVRTAEGFYYSVKKGDVLYLTDYTDAQFAAFVENDDSYNRSGNITSGSYTIPFDGKLRFLVTNKTAKTLTDSDKNYLISLIRITGSNGIKQLCEKNASDIADIFARIESIDGIVNIDKDNFEIGAIYMIAGSAWVYNYSTVRVRTKQGVVYSLKAGAMIKLSSYTGFRFAVGYRNSDNQYFVSGWKSEDFILPIDADVVIMISRNPEVTVTNEDFPLLVGMLSINLFPDSYGKSYTGEKISIRGTFGYNWNAYYAYIPTVSTINDTYGKSVTTHQAMSAYGNYIALTYSDDVIVLLDKNWNIVSVLDAETGHGNSISFSNIFYDSNDILPLLYVITTIQPDETIVKVIRISSTSSVSTIKTITFSGVNCGEGAINPVTGLFYLLGYKTGSTTDPSNNGIIVSEYDISGDSPVLLRSEDIGIFIPVIQDCEIRNGALFVVSYGKYINLTNKIYVISLLSLGVRNILTDFDQYYSSVSEPEGVTFLNNYLVTNAGNGVRAIDFEQ